jgi:lipopolysaccharide transport system ATP-binding protein
MFFQTKCIARIKKLLDSGVSLLYVSHDPGTVRQLCNRAILIQEGRVQAYGDARSVADKYAALQMDERNQAAKSAQAAKRAALDEVDVTDEAPVKANTGNALSSQPKVGAGGTATIAIQPDHQELVPSVCFQTLEIHRDVFQQKLQHLRTGTREAEFLNVQMLAENEVKTQFDFKQEATIRVFVEFHETLDNLNLSIQLRNRQGLGLVFYDLRLQNQMQHTYQAGRVYCFDWQVSLPLMCEHYHLQTILAHPPAIPGEDWAFIDSIPNAYEFFVTPVPNLPISSYVALPAQLEIASRL